MTVDVGKLSLSLRARRRDSSPNPCGHLQRGLWVSAIDPDLADTAAFCEHYDVAARVVLATTRADVNGVVRKHLGARKISFASRETAVTLTAMEYGGITPVGLPGDWPILVDVAANRRGAFDHQAHWLTSFSPVLPQPHRRVVEQISISSDSGRTVGIAVSSLSVVRTDERSDMARLIARVALVAVAAASVAVAGCSFSVGSNQQNTVAKADVADQISQKVNEKAGHKPQSVTCPDDLKATVGASLDCEMTDDGQNYGVNVTVTSVDGSKVNFDIVETVNKDDVAKSISDQLAQQFGRTPEVTCPENLKGDVGATTRCQLTDQGATYGVTVTVNSIDGADVKYSFKVDDQPKQG